MNDFVVLIYYERAVFIASLYVILQSSCDSGPCENGGDCVPEYKLNSYRCRCKLDFFGTHCEKEVMGGMNKKSFVTPQWARKSDVSYCFFEI